MLKRTPLYEAHVSLGAKVVPFAGWEMPVSYEGTIAEHTNVRERVGLFDVSHLGKLLVRGDDAAVFLDAQLSNKISDLQPGRARYTLILNEDAGIIDDLIVYAIAPGELLVVPNAANMDAVAGRIETAAPAGIEVSRPAWTTLAVQGPKAPGIVEDLYPAAKDLKYMHVARDGDVVIARTGYTGERGFEVFTTAEAARAVWDDILERVRDAGGGPVGLAARDTLRLEMGYPLHGNDIDPSTRPDEAGLMWAVKLEGRSFPGADVLRDATPARALVGLRMQDRLIPRRGSAVFSGEDQVGECTSGTFSPTLKVGVGMAYVSSEEAGQATLTIDVRGKRGTADVVQPPFVDRSPR